MKILATLLSLSLTAALPAAAQSVSSQSSSDRATWIQQSLSSMGTTKSATKSTSDKTQSVASLFPGVKLRPFVPNRYLPSEHDLELAQAQAQGPQQAAQAPQGQAMQSNTTQVQTAQLSQAQLQALYAQRQLSGNVAYNAPRGSLLSSNRPGAARMVVAGAPVRMNSLLPSIPEPVNIRETIGQIRSSLGGNEQISSTSTAQTSNTADLYPDANDGSTSQAGTTTNSLLSSHFAKVPVRGQQQQRPGYKLSYSGFQSYVNKVHAPAGSYTQGQSRASYTHNRRSATGAPVIASANSNVTIAQNVVATYPPYATSPPSLMY